MLSASHVTGGYGEIKVLRNIDFSVQDEIFAVLGANGAGKTTLLKTLARLLPAHAGSITLDGQDVTRVAPHLLPALGLAYVPQEANIFPALSVIENLKIGGRIGQRPISERLDEVFQLFPRLKDRTRQLAGTLSGGEGQMLAVGRALMQEPKVLLLDEPSAGLSPLLVDALFSAIADARKQRRLTVVLAEQNAIKALEIADRVMVLSLGAVHLIRAREGLSLSEITEAYHI